jgi:hypothetical protein
MPHLLANGHSGTIFEHLRNCFHPKDSMNGFPQLFQLCYHIAKGQIPPQIAHVLSVAYLLVMTKAFKWSLSHCSGGNTILIHKLPLCFQFHQTFATHFSPHQLGVAIKGKCEIIIHDIMSTFDLHPD